MRGCILMQPIDGGLLLNLGAESRPTRAFSEAATLFLRANPMGQALFSRLCQQHGKAKALSILAHRLGRAVYHMLKREQAFDLQKFCSCPSPKSHPACFEPRIGQLQNRTASDRPADARSNASLGRVSTLGFHCQPAGQLMSRQSDSLSS